jgi:putative addiction module antidote
MKVKLRKVGNSYTVTVPKEIVDEMGLEEGGEFDIIAKEDTVVLQPAGSRLSRAMERMREKARERGVTEADVEQAIQEIRGRR